MSAFGGDASKSCALNLYILDKHPKFFKALVQACVENHVTGYGKRGYITFIEPSSAAMKDIEAAIKKNKFEVVDEIARAHILRQHCKKPADWARFSKNNDKEHLSNGNFKRITVQEVKGKNVILDGGAQLAHVKDVGSNVSVWKVAGSGSMPVSGLADTDRAKEPRYDGSGSKGVKGGNDSADMLLLRTIQRGFSHYSDNGLSEFSVAHSRLLGILKNNDMKLYHQVLALATTNGGPSDFFIGLHMVCKARPDLMEKIWKSDNGYTEGDIKKKINAEWKNCFECDFENLAEFLQDHMAQKLLAGGNCSLSDLRARVEKMYKKLEQDGTVDGKKIYKDHVLAFLKRYPGFKAWSDYFRFYCDQSIMECEGEAEDRTPISTGECQNLMDGILARFLVNNYHNETLAINYDHIRSSVDLNGKFIHLISFVRHGVPFVHRPYDPDHTDYDYAKKSFKITKDNITEFSHVADRVDYRVRSVGGGYDGGDESPCDKYLGTATDEELEKLLECIPEMLAKRSNNSDEE